MSFRIDILDADSVRFTPIAPSGLLDAFEALLQSQRMSYQRDDGAIVVTAQYPEVFALLSRLATLS